MRKFYTRRALIALRESPENAGRTVANGCCNLPHLVLVAYGQTRERSTIS